MAKQRYYKPKHIKKFADRMRHRLSAKELMFLRRLTLGNVAPFDFQVRIGFYVADFVFPTKMLVIELDGPSHLSRGDHDARRDAFLAASGFTVWRIKNDEAALWPLSLISDHHRAVDGPTFENAVRAANRKHEGASTTSRGKPRPPLTASERKEHYSHFYAPLIAKTEQANRREAERKAVYADRKVKIIKANG
jgi:very-short-patch-repair endonuclease